MNGQPAVLQATVDGLLPNWPALTSMERTTVSRHCSAFVRRQISLAPAHIRFGFWTLLATFKAFAVLHAIGRGSTSVRPDAALAAFSRLGPAAFAGLERVLRSMTILAYLEHPTVLAAIGQDAGAR